MPVIIVEMWEGRTIEKKRLIVEGITATFAKIGVPADQVHIILKDNPKQNWGSGGKLASDGVK